MWSQSTYFASVHVTLQEPIANAAALLYRSGLIIFHPFFNLPSRSLEDYYKLIKRPVSVKGTMKRVKGIQGRTIDTGVSDFKSWDAFHDEVSYIWHNAQEYNEDGSEIFNLANELKVWSKK